MADHDERAQNEPQLAGRTAIVTGSTSGIGLAIARSLAGLGANIALNGFGDPKEIERIRKDLASEFGTGVIYFGADMAKHQVKSPR